tara:strand:- start:559 stop:843 length:285 start_codon:yes stop_codon:yes gene_type:complete
MSKYYKYFKGKITEEGVLHIDNEQYCKLLDIVFLEGGLRSFELLKSRCKTPEERYKYDVDIYKIEKKLSQLVNMPNDKQIPKNVLNAMMIKSRE